MRSHSVQIFSTTGVRVRRSAASSLVIMSACWLLIRSVVDHCSPSRNGGTPSLATICSSSWRTGTWVSGMGLSAPITRMSTLPTATKSLMLSLPPCMAALHSRAIVSATSRVFTRSPGSGR